MEIIRARTCRTVFMWAPTDGGGYPFAGMVYCQTLPQVSFLTCCLTAAAKSPLLFLHCSVIECEHTLQDLIHLLPPSSQSLQQEPMNVHLPKC